MAELRPAPFRDLVTRLYREPATQATLFELPRKTWYRPEPDDPDLGVSFHEARAGNPSGPAAGPHTQMAQNLLLSYVAGGRILELKTVQEQDQLTIPRPCIDMANVGYNIEWSQELSVAEALREYVAGAMLIEIFRHDDELTGGRLEALAGAVIYDISVGYDLAGISRDKVRGFLDGMRNAWSIIEHLRAEIPREFAAARELHYSARLSDSITLSTFHGCPAHEIEKICELLIGEHDFNLMVKMNPPMLGRERLEHLLHDVLGYTELRVNPQAYTSGLTFDEGVQLCRRLTDLAGQRGRRVGFKFSNTLEVCNRRDFFPPGNDVVYLSGQPLHVLTLALVDEFRQRVGPHVPISFSAGIDRANFPLAVACGFVPVTAVTDLLRPGGYGRLGAYPSALAKEMRKLEALDIDEYILRRFAQEEQARRRATEELGADAPADELNRAAVVWAGLLNTSRVAQLARDHHRYRAYRNRRVPARVDSRLETFDCLTCERCIPVCPNAANFVYPTPKVAFDLHDIIVLSDASWREGKMGRFEIAKEWQIANFADFCNECGNCDTFCPEHGGPYVEKPSFHRTVESWERAAPRDSFVIHEQPEGGWIRARLAGAVYQLTYGKQTQQYLFEDGTVEACLTGWGHTIVSIRPLEPLAGEHHLDLRIYHLLRYLRDGVLDQRRVNQINVQWLARRRPASGAPR
ncbi:MAG: 4Fe-4S dicluster domain-containing protein [Planctomycetes bacterium]|nr:4Fe-4S dicluster domain-containing protein [Planctomycetota bacterium]